MHEVRVLFERPRVGMIVVDRLRERQVEEAIALFGPEVRRRDPFRRADVRQSGELIENVAINGVVAARSQQRENDQRAHWLDYAPSGRALRGPSSPSRASCANLSKGRRLLRGARA